MSSKLDSTRNFIELYRHISMSGEIEVPEEFLFWSCISLISASVQNNVWVRKMGNQLFPNLYVFLIGPSGLGKGEAINSVGKIGRRVKPLHWIHTMRSSKSLLDLMTRPDKSTSRDAPKTYSWSKLFVIMPELSMAIGTGPRADDFVKLMTGLYSGSPEEIIDEGTRMSGEHSMPMPCVNWLCGSTKEWMLDSISRASLYGGFLARCVCVMGDYNLNKRNFEPTRPPDHDEVLNHLRQRLLELTQLRDVEMKLSNQARDAMEHWYYSREAPDPDDPLTPSWKREHDFILKLGTDLALADQRKVITSDDFAHAARLSRGLMNRLSELVVFAGATPETEAVHRARAILRRVKKMRTDHLIKHLDITAERMDEVRATLEKAGQVEVRVGSDGGTVINPVFIWKEDARAITLSKDELSIESPEVDEEDPYGWHKK